MIDLPIRTLAEYDQRVGAPVHASPGPDGTVIITYQDHVEVLTNIGTGSNAQPESVAIFTRDPPTIKKKVNTPRTLNFTHFTHPVKFHEESNRFISITDNTNITSWPATFGSTLYNSSTIPAFNTNSLKKTKPASIHSFHTSYRVPKNIVIVDENGSPSIHNIPTSNNVSNLPVASAVNKDINVLYAGFIHHKDSTNVVVPRMVVITANNKEKSYCLNTHSFSNIFTTSTVNVNNLNLSSSLSISPPTPDSILIAASIENSDETTHYSLSLYWSCGFLQVFSVSLTASLLSNASVASSFTIIQNKQLADCLQTSSNATNLHFISPTHVSLTIPYDSNVKNLEKLTTKPVSSPSLLLLVFETTFATIAGFSTINNTTPFSAKVVPLISESYSSPLMILTSAATYTLRSILTKPALSQVMGQAHKSAPFFAQGPKADNLLAAAGTVEAQLVTTPYPFPHVPSTTTITETSSVTPSKTFLTSLMGSWTQANDDFYQHVITHWDAFATGADTGERDSLILLFPSLSSLFLGEEPSVNKPTKKQLSSQEPTPFEFISTFFCHAATHATHLTEDGVHVPKSDTPINEYVVNSLAWDNLARTSLIYTGQAPVVSTIAVMEQTSEIYRRQLLVNIGQAEARDMFNESQEISFAKPFSPLFVALNVKYCFSKLFEMANEGKNDDRLLFLFPLRVLLCSQSVSARLVPGLLPLLLKLNQWVMVQEIIKVVPDLAEIDLVGVLQATVNGWAIAIDGVSESPTLDPEYTTIQSGKRKKPVSDAPLELLQSTLGTPLTLNYAKLLILSVINATVSPRFLKEEIKGLPFDHVLIILRYLLGWIQAFWLCGNHTNDKKRCSFMTKQSKDKLVKKTNAERLQKELPELSYEAALELALNELDLENYVQMNRVERIMYNEFRGYNKFELLDAEDDEEKLRMFDEKQQTGTFEHGMKNIKFRDNIDVRYVNNKKTQIYASGIAAVSLLSPTHLARPRLENVIEFISILLDTHFVQMLLAINTKDNKEGEHALELVILLKDITQSMLKMGDQCRISLPFLKFWNKQLNGNTKVPVPAVSDYSIQLMDL